jgi:hypothetical protein
VIEIEVADLDRMRCRKIDLNLLIENINIKIPVLVSDKEADCLLGRK